MITLTIKAETFTQAKYYADRHNIDCQYSQLSRGIEYYVTCDDIHMAKVIDWYGETDCAPYPYGSLLFYSHKADGDINVPLSASTDPSDEPLAAMVVAAKKYAEAVQGNASRMYTAEAEMVLLTTALTWYKSL